MLYNIFDLYININTLFDGTKELLSPYKSIKQKEPDMNIITTEKDIQFEKNIDDQYDDVYYEMVAIFRKITEQIYDFDGMFLHASVVKKEEDGYMFLAPSGIGKTTHTRQWTKYFYDASIINADKPIIRFFGDEVYAYGSPWCGIEGWQRNDKAKLKSAAFIEQSVNNKITKIPNCEVLKRIVLQIQIPKNPKRRIKHYELLDKLIKNIPFYLLECDISNEAVEVAYNQMRGDACEWGI